MEVRIPMAAIGKARARAGRHGHYTPAKTKAAEEEIGIRVWVAMEGADPIDGPVSMTIQAVYRPPSSWSKKRQKAAIEGQWPKVTKPDTDNIAKLVCDALNGIAYRDDALIADLSVGKNYGAADELRITIRRWGE